MPLQPYNTQTELTTSYSLFVVGADGVEREFGQVVQINPREEREVTANFVIGHQPAGEPQELVPQVVRTRTLELRRISIYDMTALQALINPSKADITNTAGNLVAPAVVGTLTDQTVPIKIVERIQNAQNQTKTRTYEGCVIRSISGERSMDRDIRVLESMTVEYRKVTETAYA